MTVFSSSAFLRQEAQLSSK